MPSQVKLPDTLERLRRRTVLLSKWLPHVPGDAIRARRHPLPPPYKRIWFFHIRKTAGTSLSKAFLALGGEDPSAVEERFEPVTHWTRSGDYRYLVGNVPLLTMHSQFFFGHGHAPSWRVKLPPDTFTLTILRDPVERVLSLYRYLSNADSDRGERYSAPPRERAWTSDGFEAFLERIPERLLLVQLWMFSPTLDPEEAARTIRGFSTYFFTESYDQGLAALTERLRLPLARRTDRVSVPASRPDPVEVAHLRDRLKPELQLIELLRESPGPGLVGQVPPLS